jgi:hypothetical protein
MPMSTRQAVSDPHAIGSKEVTFNLYEELLRAIWGKTSRTLGSPTMEVLLRQAIAKNLAQHEWLRHVRIDRQEGPMLTDLKEQLAEIDGLSLKNGFKDVISSLLETMSSLTGSIVTKPLSEMIDEYLSARGEHA